MNIRKNVLLKNLTTFKIGGMAKYFTEVRNEKELKNAVNFAKEKKLPIFILGGGSDILVSDKGVDGLVISYKDLSIKFEKLNEESMLVISGAGTKWDDLVEQCVEKGLQGIECMSGIPGTVGASPIQNIGAYGQELKDVFVSLKAFNITNNKVINFNRDDCKFGYRDSVFKNSKYWQKYVIMEITLELVSGGNPAVKYESLSKYFIENNINNCTLEEVRNAVLDIRSSKFENPLEKGNAGSFFKNPIINKKSFENIKNKYPEIPFILNSDGTYKTFAAWYIENAGLKGMKFGNAQVSDKHALILLNATGNAKAKEIVNLAKIITDKTYKLFKIKLEPEVQYIGF